MNRRNIAIILVLVVIALGAYVVFKPFSQEPQAAPDIIGGVSSVQYSNSELRFTMWYPQTATPSEVGFEGYLPLTQTPLTSFVLPRSMFEGTNLVEAGVYIGATTTPSIVAACTQPSQIQGETAAGTATFGRAEFSAFTSSGAGAGNFYEERTYRRVQRGACLEITELLHSGNIGNYPEGTVKEFDRALYIGILERIVTSYR